MSQSTIVESADRKDRSQLDRDEGNERESSRKPNGTIEDHGSERKE